jgi:hypothetical protein
LNNSRTIAGLFIALSIKHLRGGFTCDGSTHYQLWCRNVDLQRLTQNQLQLDLLANQAPAARRFEATAVIQAMLKAGGPRPRDRKIPAFCKLSPFLRNRSCAPIVVRILRRLLLLFFRDAFPPTTRCSDPTSKVEQPGKAPAAEGGDVSHVRQSTAPTATGAMPFVSQTKRVVRGIRARSVRSTCRCHAGLLSSALVEKTPTGKLEKFMAKPNSPETQQQHTARMLRWRAEDAAALKAGKLMPAHLRPAIRTTIVSSTNEPAQPTPEAT